MLLTLPIMTTGKGQDSTPEQRQAGRFGDGADWC